MELIIFLRMLQKRWWIISIILFVTIAGTFLFTYYKTPIYSAAATYVVSPSPQILDGTEFLSGLSILGGQPTVASTYATIATSAVVKQNATEALGLKNDQARNLAVFSRVRTNTHIIEITVEGNDPFLVQVFTNKIGKSTIDYVNTLNGVYNLQLLDSAVTPEQPIRPNMKINLMLGAALGLVLGIGIAFLSDLKDY
ncbi:MAG: hypothetical protein CVU39_18475 [Chloroflexi bacterium HGW-Chloroflexi-10]|nr:MAG: hypothetical protein CVU39_18475 [Chloroflexi bacterium HGW-Chloroflexi-10]